jgi:uncharacterized protein (DUF488 family)
VIWTIGHSTRTAEELLTLLRDHNIRQIADVRTAPYSRRHPQFNSETLAAFLDLHGIAYRHFPALGGRRRPRADSTNIAWRENGFRGYADHMQTPAFHNGLQALLEFAESGRTAAMCAEAVWWRCHRRLLADALVARGEHVAHILSGAAPNLHELSEFARVDGDEVTYPGLI